jgi:hypothetical protein
LALGRRTPVVVHALLRANFNQRCGLLDTGIGRRSVPPDKFDAVGEVVNRSTVA